MVSYPYSTKNIIKNYIIKLVKERGGCARQSTLVMDIVDAFGVTESRVYSVLREMKDNGELYECLSYDYDLRKHHYYVGLDKRSCECKVKFW